MSSAGDHDQTHVSHYLILTLQFQDQYVLFQCVLYSISSQYSKNPPVTQIRYDGLRLGKLKLVMTEPILCSLGNVDVNIFLYEAPVTGRNNGTVFNHTLICPMFTRY